MMRPFIIHKIIQSFTWISVTKTAGLNIFTLRALSELTASYRIIYPAALTAIAVRRTTRAAI
jgi:hypothetical protein